MTLDETLHDAFESLSDRLRAELRSAADQLTGTLRSERDRGPASSAPSPAPHVQSHDSTIDPEIDRLREAVRSIGAAASLSGILDTLADCAGREAARAAVLIIRGGRLRRWRLAGFGPEIGAAAPLDFAESASGLLADAIRRGAPVLGSETGSSVAPPFAALPAGQETERAAFPLAIGGQVVAVLYVDQGTADTSHSELNVGRLEILASHAARCLEAQTACKAARWLHDRPDLSNDLRAPSPVEGSSDAGDPSDEDVAARRYARLLVSEIKLYHERAVVAGRRDRDLATRLGDEIARARVLYDQRVPLPLRERTDYFHAELVRTLADGDSSLMAAPQMTP